MPTKKLTINGETFDVNAPYAVGHSIDEAETRVLNQTRSENIGNNLRALLKEMQDNNSSLAEMQAKVTEYDEKYTFAMGGGREPLDPLAREVRKVARAALVSQLAEDHNIKFKDLDEETQESYLDVAVQDEQVIARAKKNLKDREKKVKLNLGNLFPAQQSA